MSQIEFWFEFASTYSYPAAMRIEDLANARGVQIEWRPFLLGPIFARQGWQDSPFNIYPAKGTYMWRDLERICQDLHMPLALPASRFPQNGLKAARLTLSVADQAWAPNFVRAVYTASFAENADISDDEVLAHCWERAGGDPDTMWEAALSPENKEALKAQTERAISLGIFGAPSFTVQTSAGSELFWGHDRLEAALDWAVRAT